ncbi:MAG: hypothetical protein IPP77_00325 [Bacteroidetes bacterium]|nr:hypothetical protein [Bacteroidota bacterium]
MKKLIFNTILLLILASMSSCLKETFDPPPYGGKDPIIDVNFNIDQLKARYAGTNYFINEDLVISAVVVADDKSGNFYKTLIIEDSTTHSGIALSLNSSYLYTNYPIGRHIVIKLRGLFLVSDHNLLKIVGSIAPDGSFDGIPSPLLDRFILKGTYFHDVAPIPVTVSQLNSNIAQYQNSLVELSNVEFQQSDAGKTYADGYNKISQSRTLKDCNGNSIITYNSGYASFANALTPTGNGKIQLIVSQYGNTPQMLIRNLSDLHLDSVRCGGSVTPGVGIAGIRSSYGGNNVTLPAGTSLTGIVISDKTYSNCDPKNIVIQDSTGGMVVRFSATHSFKLGDQLTIDLSGITLTSFSGLIEVENVPLSAATAIGTGIITPRTATIAEINANGNAWESTLLKIVNVTITGGTGGNYSGTCTLNDGTGSVAHFTRSQATFASTPYPTGTVSLTGYLADFNGFQMQIRSTTDVQ